MEKTENLILYICDKLKDQDTFGSTVFNKVLYYIDNISYLKTGKKISDFKYVKQKNGPTPNPEKFLPFRDSLITQRKLKLEDEEYFGRIKKVPKNKIKPDISSFSSNEMKTINTVINAFRYVNGSVASSFSHDEISWHIAHDREELPFYTYLLSSGDILKEDVQWAKSVLDVHN